MRKKITSITALCLASLMITSGIFLLKFTSFPPQIPLFYSRLEGDDQIADLFLIFLLPLLTLIMVFTNTLFVRKYLKENALVTKITYYINITIISLLTFIFVRIVFLIT